MKSRTRRALLGSIKKWEAIVAGTGEDHRTENCPLCEMFYKDSCKDCPVMLSTGDNYCENSPYVYWDEHRYGRIVEDCPECLRLAQAELDFLKSLLPTPTPTPK